ncbi:MAG: adenylate/guanylate cyclase domain-containing protein, partial [Leptospiraceae bacterium]|nr:adenylate/guanylate cyclase domain-containing protein [Leptospiraceae bacterium]
YFEYLYKLEYLSVYLATPLFFSFIYYVFKEVISKKFGYFLWIVSLLFCVTVIFFDTIVFSQFITYFYIVLFTGCLYGIYGLIISSIKKLPGAKICLIGFTGFVITIVNDIFYSQGVIRSIYMAHYGFLFFIFSQSMILSFKFSLAFRESESLRNSMERFVPIQFLKSLDKSSISDINVGDSINKQYSVLFTDIRDFTSLSESMTPQDNFLFLNTYLKYMEPAIKEHNGFIDKFIGDAIMALFEGNPGNAVNAALSMTAKLIEYNHEREKDGLRPIEIGVGINSGDLILGTVGTHNRLDTTVIGDTVNLSSRLESLNKKFGTTILISESVYLTLHDKDIYDLRELGFVKIKGKQKAIKIYEIFNNDKKDIKEKKSKTLKEFTSGINNLKISDYKEAYNCFIRVLREFPEDKISKIYLNLSKKKINQFNLGDTNPMIPDISELA